MSTVAGPFHTGPGRFSGGRNTETIARNMSIASGSIHLGRCCCISPSDWYDTPHLDPSVRSGVVWGSFGTVGRNPMKTVTVLTCVGLVVIACVICYWAG